MSTTIPDTKLKIGVIGVGNAGCQIAELAQSNNYPCYCINSSQKDLSDEVVSKHIPSWLLGDYRGAGRIRKIAKEFLLDDLKKMGTGKSLFEQDKFIEILESNDIIIMITSASGGTGSGVTPLLCNRIQKAYPNKVIISIGIAPKMGEAIAAHSNYVEFSSEIQSLNIPYMQFDLSAYENKSDDDAYIQIAKDIVDKINIIRGDIYQASKFQMIDERDRLVTLSEIGYMAIYHIKDIDQRKIEESSIQDIIIENIKKSSSVDILKDKRISYMSLILNLPSEMDEDIKSGNLSKLKDYIGDPIDVYKNYSVSSHPKGEIALILSGMSIPYTRISASKDIVTKHAEHMSKIHDIEVARKNEFAFLKESANMDKILQKDITVIPKNAVADIDDIPEFL